MSKKGIDIVSIGDELLIGQVVNTNASWMGEKLNAKGLAINRIIAIADSKEAIINSLIDSSKTAKLILFTGGLGPTKDDITKHTICDFFDSKLIINKEVLAHVKAFFKKRGRELTPLNYDQALLPDNCEIIFNSQGTAPAMYFIKNGTHYVFMPGVPFEMKNLMNNWVIPHFTKLCNASFKVQKTVLTSGIGESFLAEKIENWENALGENTKLAYLPSPGRVRLRLSVSSYSYNESELILNKHIEALKLIIPELIYGFDNDLIEKIIGELLINKKATIATAESCTGGMIAQKITSIAGSSKYFKGSIIAYANEPKIKQLTIPEDVINNHGAVSEAVAKLMANNVRQLLNTDYAISTTGIAGPDGGTTEKPVGTVWIGFASKDKIEAKKYNFGDQRERNTKWAVQTALNKVRKELLKDECK